MGAFVERLENVSERTEKIIDLLENTEHAGFIREICQHLIIDSESKYNCVIIHGAPNAGKSQFLMRLSEVFELTYYE